MKTWAIKQGVSILAPIIKSYLETKREEKKKDPAQETDPMLRTNEQRINVLEEDMKKLKRHTSYRK